MSGRVKLLIRGAFFLECNGYAAALEDHVALFDSLNVDLKFENFRPMEQETVGDRPYHQRVAGNLFSESGNKHWKPDVCLNYLAPNVAKLHPGCKNIMFVYWETSKIPGHDQARFPYPDANNWVQIMNSFDEIWTASPYSRKSFEDSGVNVPVEVLPWSLHGDSFDKPRWNPGEVKFTSVNTTEEVPVSKIRDEYEVLYCTVGEFQPRKNYSQLLRAFCHAFLANERVALLIKTSDNGIGKLGGRSIVDLIREQLGGFDTCGQKLPDIFVNTQSLEKNAFVGLLDLADYYYSCTRGEGMGGPLILSLAQGTPLVCSAHTSVADYATTENAVLYPSAHDYISNMTSPHYDSGQMWQTFNDLQISRALVESEQLAGSSRYKKMSEAAVHNVKSQLSKESLVPVLRKIFSAKVANKPAAGSRVLERAGAG